MRFFLEISRTFHRRKTLCIFLCVVAFFFLATGRLIYLMIGCREYYTKQALDLEQRERAIKAARGDILDRNGVVLASNSSVCTISVIHNQIKEPEKVIEVLAKELNISEEKIAKRVNKITSIERIKNNVDKEIGNRILSYGLEGVKVDEDYRRYYPYDSLASKVIGFTGGDNQGIVGLEVKYDEYLMGENGKILTLTDARGVEVYNAPEYRTNPKKGNNLVTSLDYNIQSYCMQEAKKAYIAKEADGVEVIVMNPQNGEILSMVDYPEYDLNNPFVLNEQYSEYQKTELESEYQNKMWRNWCVCDTYEPGSIFKIITTSIALEKGVVNVEDRFYCPGYIYVEDRKIRCHKTTGHGAESFAEGIQNSCNPVFIDVGLRIGAENYYDYMQSFGILNKTEIDLPGEAKTIMHKKEAIGPVELATISFGQSFQVTPIQLATTVSSLINGGTRITPHVGCRIVDDDGTEIERLSYESGATICSKETSDTLKELLEGVVSQGGGKNAYLEGYEIGGKTATSQTLPRSANKYISSFLGFYPASDPKVLILVIIRNPSGVYYGGTIAAPVARTIFENILPYLDN